MFDMMKKLQEAQRAMQDIKDRLGRITVEGADSSGNVKITATGNRNITRVEISDSAHRGDKDALERMLMNATNDAIAKAEAVNESEMKSATGSLMPGLGGMFK